MNSWIFWGIAICFGAMMLTGLSLSAEKPVIVNLMVDYDMPASNIDNLINIYNVVGSRNMSWTLFLTEKAAINERLFLATISPSGNIEMEISGNNSDEKLSTVSYAEQKDILGRAKTRLELCKICDVNEVHAKGFKPQSFDQNEDTYKVLDEMGIIYDTGFKAGILYAPGHEKDVWPYKVENHEFYAVPVSTYALSGENVALDDREIKDKGLSSSQWYDMLVGKFNEVSGKDEPMVISLSTSISGTGDYLDALKQFLDYAKSGDASFVKTNDLVNMSITGVHEATGALLLTNAAIPAEKSTEATTSGCAECDTMKDKTNINAEGQNNTTMVITV
jgi:hypothetical protein